MTQTVDDLIRELIEEEMETAKEDLIKDIKEMVLEELKDEFPILDIIESHTLLRNGTLHLNNVEIEK